MDEYIHWEVGQVRFSPIYKASFLCLERFFEKNIEYVLLRKQPDGKPFLRTAGAMSDPLFPWVNGLGGVTESSYCIKNNHYGCNILIYNGDGYCDLCGSKIYNRGV